VYTNEFVSADDPDPIVCWISAGPPPLAQLVTLVTTPAASVELIHEPTDVAPCSNGR
jgi:hypothetical protein